MMKNLAIWAVAVFLTMVCAPVTHAGGSSTFTYQGRLTDADGPVQGPVNLAFRLFDAAVSGNQVGPELVLSSFSDFDEAGGLTVDLDFGAGVFDGAERWLEVWVGGAPLSPRQAIHPTPYAMVADTVTSVPSGAIAGAYGGITGVGTLSSLNVNGHIGVGTTGPLSALHVVGTENNGTDAALRIVSGAQTMFIDGNEIDTDSPIGLFLNNNVATNVVLANGGGNVGIGTNSPTAALDVVSETANAGNNTARFSAPNLGPNTSHIHYGPTGDWYIRSAALGGKVILQDNGGNVGIGTTSPSARLQVEGGTDTGIQSKGAPGILGVANDASTYGATFGGSGFLGSGQALLVTGDSHLLGKVGIGTTSPDNALSVYSASPFSIYATNTASGGTALFGASATSGFSIGVWGNSSAPSGTGVFGRANAPSGFHYGVRGNSNSGYGVFAEGQLGASGTKSFRIDHPDDPENMYLLHYSAESPEVINFYSGNITLDAAGEAMVELPPYFAKINTDPRYTLTAIGAPMPNLYIAEEIDAAVLIAGARAEPDEAASLCSFRIAGGAPGAKVSWEIKAVRNDLWMQQRGAPVEVDKQGAERGTYQHPEFYGLPRERE